MYGIDEGLSLSVRSTLLSCFILDEFYPTVIFWMNMKNIGNIKDVFYFLIPLS